MLHIANKSPMQLSTQNWGFGITRSRLVDVYRGMKDSNELGEGQAVNLIRIEEMRLRKRPLKPRKGAHFIAVVDCLRGILDERIL